MKVQLSPLKVDNVSVIVVASVHNNYAARSIDDLQKGGSAECQLPGCCLLGTLHTLDAHLVLSTEPHSPLHASYRVREW